MKINMREEMDFLDRSNEFNCDHCYYNRDYDDFQHRLPCGQWNCWVTIYCDRAEALDDEEQEETYGKTYIQNMGLQRNSVVHVR